MWRKDWVNTYRTVVPRVFQLEKQQLRLVMPGEFCCKHKIEALMVRISLGWAAKV